jgi:hypothetical protein
VDEAKLQSRHQIYNYFLNVARKDEDKNNQEKFEDIFDSDDYGRRILFVMEKSAGDVFMTTALIKDLHETYPEYNIYFATAPSNFELVEGCEGIHKIIPFQPQMENLLNMEGAANHKGFVDICFLPFVGTQKILNYLHNGQDVISLDIKNF